MNDILISQGYYLIDVDVVALNNAGKSTLSNFDNGVATKCITKNGRMYPYVSGQAVRNWWRNGLQKICHWTLSPVVREDKIAFTHADPLEYADDDVFGYMRAASEEVTDAKGKKKKTNVTVTRISPLKNSAIVAACSVRPVENWSSMARQEGDSVPYGKQEYSAVMKGMFSLDLNQVGTFSNYNKTGYQNLSQQLKEKAMEMGCSELNDPFVPGQKLVRLPLTTRQQRATDTIKVLKNISGGAMQTNNMGDVTPKFIVLATTNTGNHPFSHITSSYGERDEMVKLNVAALKEVIEEYKDNFVGKLFIGKRKGFFDDNEKELMALQEAYPDLVVFGPVNAMIDAYCEQITQQMQ
ncbi:type I-B CRISPR-associated protein Cas7/Cst2/DevR [uncultured Bacteroides sp.]|jgi:CRISPR-associated protein Cst2|uniref:type I-B CRISPR-associated protein Cas7/Cst2/DevR n=1 Tax=uncultured Bacteroides sp. TaxID=162156 RepID=UPI0025E54FC8|nr:type I-B CRISPR-associated protein Cas7/Cst2/DevR [uncultured Bacteroides sp.]